MCNWNYQRWRSFAVRLNPKKDEQVMNIYLVSACLLGLRTRYDGRVVSNPAWSKFAQGAISIPVCPEQLGGLPTPRSAADLVGGDGYDVLAGRARVISRDGHDVTENFILGARQVLAIARQQSVAGVLLKARSPSCGLSPATGVTAALLREEGYEIVEVE
jgi:uncharacterized protein YbbK (DUF523 family)